MFLALFVCEADSTGNQFFPIIDSMHVIIVIVDINLACWQIVCEVPQDFIKRWCAQLGSYAWQRSNPFHIRIT